MEKKRLLQTGQTSYVDADVVPAPRYSKASSPAMNQAQRTSLFLIGAIAAALVLIATLALMISNWLLYIQSMSMLLQILVWAIAIGLLGVAIFWGWSEIESRLDQRSERKRLNDYNVADITRINAEAAKLQAEAVQTLRTINFDNFGNAAVIGIDVTQITQLAGQFAQPVARSITNNNTVDPKLLEAPAFRGVPDGYDLVDIFTRRHIPSGDIFLGIADGGDMLTVDAEKDLCHGVFNAVTGRGKTIIQRGIITQLLPYHQVILADIKFTLFDEKGNDYRPIARSLLAQEDIEISQGYRLPHLVLDIAQVKDMITWLVTVELPRRLKMYHRGDHSYPVLYVFLEEFLYLVRLFPEVAGHVETIITVGRSLKVKLFTVAQNFLTKDTKLSGGMREQFETAIYLGGDDHSGAVILDMGKKSLMDFLTTNNIRLGQGVAMMRNNKVAPEARVTRFGMSSNNFVYHVLGRADDFVLPDEMAQVVKSNKSLPEIPVSTPFSIIPGSKPDKMVEQIDAQLVARARELNLSDAKLAKALNITQYQANKLNNRVREESEVTVND